MWRRGASHPQIIYCPSHSRYAFLCLTSSLFPFGRSQPPTIPQPPSNAGLLEGQSVLPCKRKRARRTPVAQIFLVSRVERQSNRLSNGSSV